MRVDGFDRAPIAHGSRRVEGRKRRRVWPALALAGAVAAAGVALARRREDTAALPAPPPERIVSAAYAEDDALAPLATLDIADGARARPHYQACTRPGTADRRDALSAGDLRAGGAYYRVALRREGRAPPRGSFFLEMATLAAEAGAAVLRATNPAPLDSAKGRFEWAPVTLAVGGVERPCLGFRLARPSRTEVSGLACGETDAPLDAGELAALIGRLTPTPAGLESGLGQILAVDPARAAVRRRTDNEG